MSMYFFDETDDWPEYQTVRQEIHRLERENLELLKELKEAESAVASDPTGKDLKAKIDGIKKKLKETERKLDESLSMYR